MAVEILPVWNRINPRLQSELARFWIDQKAMLDAAKASERAAQVVCVARDGDALVGISTAYPRIVPRLRQPMYYYRNYIAPGHRNLGLSIPFVNASFDEIERQELARDKLQCIGVIMALQNEFIARHYDEAYWWQSKFVYAGLSRDGEQLRVRYFRDARLLPPAVLGAKAPTRA